MVRGEQERLPLRIKLTIVVGVDEQRSDLFFRPAREAASNLGDLEPLLAVYGGDLIGVHQEARYVELDFAEWNLPAGASSGHMARRDAEAIALRPEALMQDGSVLFAGDLRRPAAVDTLLVAAECEYHRATCLSVTM